MMWVIEAVLGAILWVFQTIATIVATLIVAAVFVAGGWCFLFILLGMIKQIWGMLGP